MMRIRPLAAARKLSRGLFEQLAEQIKSGRLAPGERLPTEAELTRAARVSRTVVREAKASGPHTPSRGSGRTSRWHPSAGSWPS